MDCMTEKAYAKINFTLPVLRRRADGYHEVDTVMHSISLADTITLAPAEKISLAVTEGNAPEGPENLMWQAAQTFFRLTGIKGGAAMTLAKRIPSEAGLGGGSADAAAVLRGLARMTGAGLSSHVLERAAASLGADIPFCIRGGCARCGGIGDVLTPLPAWPGLSLLIVRPNISVSTGPAYREIDKRKSPSKNTSGKAARAIETRNLSALMSALSNDFEAALFPIAPVLRETKQELTACGWPAMMSGSGSAFFMMLPRKERPAAAQALRAAYPEWFVEEAETVGAVNI